MVKDRPYREAFFTSFGDGPYECFLCRRSVVRSDVTVHHQNFRRDCDHPYNLVPMHDACHNRYHNALRKGKPRAPEMQELLRTVNVGRKLTEAHKAKINATGRRHSPEVKGRMAEARRKYWAEHPRPVRLCEHCQKPLNAGKRFCSYRCSNLGAPRGNGERS